MSEGNPKKIETKFPAIEKESQAAIEHREILKSAGEIEPENPEAIVERLENLRKKMNDLANPSEVETDESAVIRSEKIKQHQEQYLPKYLKKRRGLLAESLVDAWLMGTKFELEGQENIPNDGPFLVVCNHFGANDVQALLKTFKENNLHFVVSKSIWWKGFVFGKWFMKQLKAIPVQESLANLSEIEKEEALKRQGGAGKKAFRNIIDREKQGGLVVDTEFIRQAVAVLSQGDALGIFPEGLWLNPQGMTREKAEMKKGYRGLELIASQYKKLTGLDLPILPTAFNEDGKTKKKKLTIGKSIDLSDNETELNSTDWCMAKIAAMLPEEKRGYYTNITHK